ncbi:Hypothetical protein SMAX5B_009552 [Scophthalmus maximus]|uniref:Uncharacterized protein n=1 Tax=Scophthalmus maximus TaxID=52904 RepID=A0A2U9AZA1_SCOMX|nr:Hypothetical protein SMAX5B_009552 [Scophthalmus maximus]
MATRSMRFLLVEATVCGLCVSSLLWPSAVTEPGRHSVRSSEDELEAARSDNQWNQCLNVIVSDI